MLSAKSPVTRLYFEELISSATAAIRARNIKEVETEIAHARKYFDLRCASCQLPINLSASQYQGDTLCVTCYEAREPFTTNPYWIRINNNEREAFQAAVCAKKRILDGSL